MIGEFARSYTNAGSGHVGGTDGSRRATHISAVTAVPEPATWENLLAGLGVVGALGSSRRRRNATAGQTA